VHLVGFYSLLSSLMHGTMDLNPLNMLNLRLFNDTVAATDVIMSNEMGHGDELSVGRNFEMYHNIFSTYN
jgi:hypothetical protein